MVLLAGRSVEELTSAQKEPLFILGFNRFFDLYLMKIISFDDFKLVPGATSFLNVAPYTAKNAQFYSQ